MNLLFTILLKPHACIGHGKPFTASCLHWSCQAVYGIVLALVMASRLRHRACIGHDMPFTGRRYVTCLFVMARCLRVGRPFVDALELVRHVVPAK